MNSKALLGWLMLGAFIVFGTNFYARQHGECPEPTLSLAVKDGEKLVMEASDSWFFARNGNNIQVPIVTRDALSQLRTYLEDHPDRRMIVTGLYMSEEKNFSYHRDLGFARAQSFFDYLSGMDFPTDRIDVASEQASNFRELEERLYDAIAIGFSSKIGRASISEF